MRVHHLNCISSCPLGGALMDGRSRSLRARLTCHCLLVEAGNELVLVDTGYGLGDVFHASTRLSQFFLFLLDPDFREEMTAVRQVAALGYDPRDVRHIVLSHLDFDHAGGLDDFPAARVHMLAAERESAEAQRTWLDRQRYRPQQWSTMGNWMTYPASEGESWLGFGGVRRLVGLPPEILLVPLPGHTFGHAGIAVQAGSSWLLLAGDAFFDRGEMDLDRPRCTPGLRFYQWMMEKDRRARLANRDRLRHLVRREGDRVLVIPSHDPVVFEKLADRPAGTPAGALDGRRRKRAALGRDGHAERRPRM